MSNHPRPMSDHEIEPVATLWHDTWHLTHDGIAPQPLCDFRGPEYFRSRTEEEKRNLRVLGPPGQPIALCIAAAGNLDMLFVAVEERGKGYGEILLHDAESRIRTDGYGEAHLYVALGNHAAIRFYRRHAWSEVEQVDKLFGIAGGTMPIRVGRMTRIL